MNRTHRVLYVDTAPTVGGSVISLHQLLCKLDRSRYEPIVLSYTPHAYVDSFRALGLDVVVWDAYAVQDHRPGWVKEARDLTAVRWLRRTAGGARLYHTLGFVVLLARRVWPRARAMQSLIRQKRIDLVHTNIRVGHDREAIVAARIEGVPCVSHIRDFEELNWFDRRLAGTVSAFIYISEAVQQCHLRAGIARSKGRVVYNAVDISSLSGTLDMPGTRRSLGLASDDLVVGMVGRLERWKGQDVFLRAMALVKEAIPRARGVLIGDPVPYDLEYRQGLLSLCDSLGLSQRVQFVPFRRDLPAVMAALDLLVLASTSPEPFGRVLIEAMAAGKPVVATDAGAVGEIVDDGAEGILVPPGDAQALAEAVVFILTHPERAAAMGQNGRDTVRRRFDMHQHVDAVQSVYGELLA
jgi:glycosyltransferase involved in cell wall biosynthesis